MACKNRVGVKHTGQPAEPRESKKAFLIRKWSLKILNLRKMLLDIYLQTKSHNLSSLILWFLWERKVYTVKRKLYAWGRSNSEGQSVPCNGASIYLEGNGNNTQVSTWKWHQGAMTNGRMTSLKGIGTQALAWYMFYYTN